MLFSCLLTLADVIYTPTSLNLTLLILFFNYSQIKHCRASPRSLFFAAKQGNVLQLLVLAAGCNVNTSVPQENHKTAMHAAAAAGQLLSLRMLYWVSVLQVRKAVDPTDSFALPTCRDVHYRGRWLLRRE